MTESFDDAFEWILQQLVEDDSADLEDLLTHYPQWADRLRSAVGQMESAGFLRFHDEELDLESALPGDLQNRYTERSALGKGGMGHVELAHDRSLGRRIALKTIRATSLDKQALPPSTATIRRFLHEAQVVASLPHPNIIPIYDIHRDEDGFPGFTMRLVDGPTLQESIKDFRDNKSDLSAQEYLGFILNTLERICDAIAFAHDRGIIHRDLKPANVMVGRFGEVLVLDWGLAASTKSPLTDDGAEMGNLPAPPEPQTVTGATLGTPAYMAPEHATGQGTPPKPTTDVFGVGTILYYALSGKAPFSAKTPQDSLALAQLGKVHPLRPLSDELKIPRELRAIVQCALARDPSKRYQDVKSFVADLQAYQTARRGQAWSDAFPTRLAKTIQRNPLTASLLGAAAVVVSLVLLVRSESSRADELAVRTDELSTRTKMRVLTDELSDIADDAITFATPADTRTATSAGLNAEDQVSLERYLDTFKEAGVPLSSGETARSLPNILANPDLVDPNSIVAFRRALERIAVLLWVNDYAQHAEQDDGKLSASTLPIPTARDALPLGERGIRAWQTLRELLPPLLDETHLEAWEALLALVRSKDDGVLKNYLLGALTAERRDDSLLFMGLIFERVAINPKLQLDIWRRIALLRPGLFEAHYRAADLAIRGTTADARLAVRHAQAARSLRPNSYYAAALLVYAHTNDQNYQFASLEGKRLQNDFPNAPAHLTPMVFGWLHTAVGRSRRAEGKEAEAVKEFELALKAYRDAFPTGRNNFVDVASVLQELDRADEAEAFLKQLIEREQREGKRADIRLRRALVDIYSDSEEHQKILQVYLDYLDRDESSVAAWQDAAIACEHLGYYEHALLLIDAALARNNEAPAKGLIYDPADLQARYSDRLRLLLNPLPTDSIADLSNAAVVSMQREETWRSHQAWSRLIEARQSAANDAEWAAPTNRPIRELFQFALRNALSVTRGEGFQHLPGQPLRWKDGLGVLTPGFEDLEPIPAGTRAPLQERSDWEAVQRQAAQDASAWAHLAVDAVLALEKTPDTSAAERRSAEARALREDPELSALFEREEPHGDFPSMAAALESVIRE